MFCIVNKNDISPRRNKIIKTVQQIEELIHMRNIPIAEEEIASFNNILSTVDDENTFIFNLNGVTISNVTMKTLRPGMWLNDEVFY